MNLLLHTALAFAASPDAVVDALAPGPEELARVQDELEQRLLVAEALQRAVARLQGDASRSTKGCSDPDQAQRLSRLRAFADPWHDAVQRARIQADRLTTTANAPTVALVVDDERRELVGGLLARTDRQVDAWLELVSWFSRTSPRACDVPLTPFGGVPTPGVLAAGEEVGAAAVLVTDGQLCQDGGPALAAGLHLVDHAGCWTPSGERCGCDPVEVLPGAVFGQPIPEAAQP